MHDLSFWLVICSHTLTEVSSYTNRADLIHTKKWLYALILSPLSWGRFYHVCTVACYHMRSYQTKLVISTANVEDTISFHSFLIHGVSGVSFFTLEQRQKPFMLLFLLKKVTTQDQAVHSRFLPE